MAKGKVYMNWRAHNIKGYINVNRCFKCHGYGHIAKACNQESLCEKCGEKDHMKISCIKSTVVCINCKRSRRGNDQHAVRILDCPEYKRHLEIYKSKIKWS